jgi:hypothetical protein
MDNNEPEVIKFLGLDDDSPKEYIRKAIEVNSEPDKLKLPLLQDKLNLCVAGSEQLRELEAWLFTDFRKSYNDNALIVPYRFKISHAKGKPTNVEDVMRKISCIERWYLMLIMDLGITL